MKTQISRDTYPLDKRYSGVYQQQGRMLTDADWNALAEIVKRRLDEALADVVGSGAPRGRGFGMVQDASGLLFGGRLYAGGVPARVVPARAGEACSYGNQADFPAPPPLPTGMAYTLYADVWERTVDSLEDTGPWAADHLRDPALHGADTTTRTQTMAQVKWCPTFPGPEDLEANLPIGDSRLSVALLASQTGSDLCDPCAQEVAVTRRVGNYLFRLEVHHVVASPSTPPSEVVLKWSSENGAELHRVGTEPADFKAGDYVYEFHNDTTEKHLGVHFAEGFTPARGVLHETYPATPPAGFDRVRRWDGYARLVRSAGGAWSLANRLFVTVEPGGDLLAPGWEKDARLGGFHPLSGKTVPEGRDREVPLRVSASGTSPGDIRLGNDEVVLHLRSLALTLQTRSLVAGDYWLAPVRESLHQAGDKVLDNAPPSGILHHYLRLADIAPNGTVQPPGTDRAQRLSFPSLTDLAAGDVDYSSACPLFRDTPGGPIDTVQKALDRLCSLSASDIAFQKPCDTSLFAGVSPRSIRTVADALRLLCDIEARHVEYTPPADCTLLQGSTTVEQALSRICDLAAENVAYTGCANLDGGIKTVKDALDKLCERPSGGGCEVTIGAEGEFRTLKEAVTTLLGKGKTDLCLCLLPGEHRLDEPLSVHGRGKAIQLTLHGCGGRSRLTFGAPGVLNCQNLRSLRIEHLVLQLDPPAQLVARGGLEVTLEGVVVTGTATRPPGAPPPVLLHATLSVRVAACRFQFLNEEGLVGVGNLLNPLHPPLGELFSSRLDEERFETQRKAVVENLVSLPARPRSVLVRGLSAVLGQASIPLADPVRRSLERFSTSISPQLPERSTVSDSLDDIRWVSLRAVPSLALVIEPAAGDATLVDNQIVGVVSVYGVPEGAGPTSEQLQKLVPGFGPDSLGRAAIQFLPAAGRLSIDRNEISRLTVGGAPQRRLRELTERPTGTVAGIYRAAYVAQNRFTSGANQVLAKDARLTDNFFEPVEADLGAAVADTAIYSGNGSAEDDNFLFHNITRRHNLQTKRDLNTMFIVP